MRKFQACIKAQLVQNVVNVTLDGVNGQAQCLGDFLIAASCGNQVNNVLLALGEADPIRDPSGIDFLQGVLDDLGEK